MRAWNALAPPAKKRYLPWCTALYAAACLFILFFMAGWSPHTLTYPLCHALVPYKATSKACSILLWCKLALKRTVWTVSERNCTCVEISVPRWS